MIRRTEDCSIFSNKELNDLLNKIKEIDNRQLYKVCNSKEELEIAKKELKMQGYNYETTPINNEKTSIYSVMPDKIDLREAENCGQFKKLAWGRYCFQKVNSINGFESYNYDDGSIWKTITDENGKQYLVKEVDDDNDDKIVRNKIATLDKRANMMDFVNEQNINNVISILYSNDNIANLDFFKDLLNSNIKMEVFKFIESKLEKIMMEKLQQQNIFDEKIKTKLIDFIKIEINNSLIMNKNSFDSEVSNFIEDNIVNENYSNLENQI